MRIVSDTATLYSPEEGRKMDVKILPVYINIDGVEYRDYEDIDGETFLKLVEAGGVPSSSQPSIGELMDVFEESNEEVLLISVGDGLSGAYQSAVGAKNSIENSEYIHILDSKSLAAPHRYLVNKAVRLREEGFNIGKIIEELQKSIESSISFVIPSDFDFLKRSGRLTPIAATIGGLIKIVPVMTQTEDRKRIEPFAIKRSSKKAVEAIINHLKTKGINEEYLISICHAGVVEKAASILAQFKEHFQNASFEMMQLSPSLMTHGGPGCVTIQVVKK